MSMNWMERHEEKVYRNGIRMGRKEAKEKYEKIIKELKKKKRRKK